MGAELPALASASYRNFGIRLALKPHVTLTIQEDSRT